MVTPSFYPIKGGTETVVHDLAVALNKNSIHTDIMTFNMDKRWNAKWRGKTETIDGITVFRIPALNWMPITHSPRITLGINLIPARFRHILKNYDIIHFHEFELSFPIFSFMIRRPKIIHSHGIDVEFLKRYHLNRLLLKHAANYYISITKKMRKELIQIGFPAERIIYLPNGINSELFFPKREKEDNLLLFVGRITASKGLHILLKSLQHVETSVHLVVIGPCDWNKNYCLNILNQIKRENQRGRHKITYLGPLDRPKIVKWYQKASIFVLPSFMEGFPVTVLEALSCRTPVIATPVGGIPEVIRNRENGLLVPLNSPVKLAEAIQFLLENENARKRFGRNGRELILKEFSLQAVVSKLCKIYRQILGSFNPIENLPENNKI